MLAVGRRHAAGMRMLCVLLLVSMPGGPPPEATAEDSAPDMSPAPSPGPGSVKEMNRQLDLLKQRLEVMREKPARPTSPDQSQAAPPVESAPPSDASEPNPVASVEREATPPRPSSNKLNELERRANVLESLVVGRGHTRGLMERGPGWSEHSGFFLQSADGNFFLKLTGFVQAEYRAFPGGQNAADPGTDPDTFNVRRLRPALDGRILRQFRFQIAPDFAPRKRSEVFNAFIDWEYFSWARVRVGQFKPNVSIEMTQGEADLIFIERSLVQNLGPYRDFGVQITGRVLRQSVRYDFGVLNGSPAGPSNQPELGFSSGKRLMARLMLTPFANFGPRALREFDFGMGFTNESTRQQTGQQQMLSEDQARIIFQYNSNVVGDGDTTRFTPFIRWYWGRFGIMPLWTHVTTHQMNTTTNVRTNLHHDAWTVQGSFLLTDDHATFDRVEPKKPFDLKKGHWGAVELAARYSELRIDPQTFALGMADATQFVQKTKSFEFGINWYLSHNLKMQWHWIHDDFRGANSTYKASSTLDSLLYRITLIY